MAPMSGLRGLTYAALAERYGVPWCDGKSCPLSAPRHDRGVVLWDREIHWRDRIVTRSGLRRFLILVARVMRVRDGGVPKRAWETRKRRRQRANLLYLDNVFASKTAFFDLGVRIPASLSDQDRERVRKLLAGDTDEVKRSPMGRWAELR